MKSFIKNKRSKKISLYVLSFVLGIFFANISLDPKATVRISNLYYDTIGTYMSKAEFIKESDIFIGTLEKKNPLCYNALMQIRSQYKELMNDKFYRYMYYGNDDPKEIKRLDKIENKYISLNCPIEELLVLENIYNTALLRLYMD